MDFHGVDLNLLVAFDALMRERNVTRAAADVGVSQPAMSAALGRLRKLAGDPLFHRSSSGLLPTARARDLAGPISEALLQVRAALVQEPAFDPALATQTFALGLSDYPAFVLLPGIMLALRQRAPGSTLAVHSFTARDESVDLLDAGAVDVAIGVPPRQSDRRILSRPILRDTFVTIVASEHPAARKGMDMKTFLSLPHVLASPEGEGFGLVDQALAQQGKRRRLALTLPQMFVLPSVVARTDMTATVMRRVVIASAAARTLVTFPPPIPLPDIVFDAIWHRRTDANPAQRWFRGLIEECARAL
ncbi:MAG: LysR family transcriptional regulator [Luteibacter sp.]